ncbi:MAG: hypothetical protein KA003_13450 [Caldilineaceae bacterium]|nr:hypothetical protein [Caldilineaceae bacterium]MBP8107505.1 hypothetical protein [Caldilineaceae bacterium]MBP8123018.1 hypothetical protein [Caldilineaceae bacterium]
MTLRPTYSPSRPAEEEQADKGIAWQVSRAADLEAQVVAYDVAIKENIEKALERMYRFMQRHG